MKVDHNVAVAGRASWHPDGDWQSEISVEIEKKSASDNRSPVDVKSISDNEKNITYPSGVKLTLIMLSLCAVSFSVGLNNTIITTSIPTIAGKFHALQDIGWYGSAFYLADTSLQPIFGKLYTFWAVKKVYIFVLILFQVGIFLQATAVTSPMFIIGRAVSGVGSAGLIVGGINTISHLAVKERRPMFMGLGLCFNIISSSCGPILSGTLSNSEAFAGPRCFIIVLPLPFISTILFTLLFKPVYAPERHSLSIREKIRFCDPLGCFLLTSSVLSLLIALHYGSSDIPWTFPQIIAPLCVSIALFFLFILSQIYSSDDVATIPRRVFTRRAIWSSYGLGFTLFLVLNSHQFFLPYYFQAVRSYSPMKSATSQIPYFLSYTLSAIFVAVLPRGIFGYYNPFMLLGASLALIGSCLMHTLGLHTPVAAYVGYEILAGYGTGMAGMAIIVAVSIVLREEDQPIGLALVVMSEILADAVSVSTANTIFVGSLLKTLGVAGGVTPAMTQAVLADPSKVRQVVPPTQVPVVLKALVKSLSNIFVLPIAGAALAIGFACLSEWIPISPKEKVNFGEDDEVELVARS